MSWEETLKMPKFLRTIVNTIQNDIPEFEVTDVDANRAHGGKIDFTETQSHERHEDEPHSLYTPNTPKNKGNYLRKLPRKLKNAAEGRSRRFGQGGMKLASEEKEEWFGVLKAPRPFRDDTGAKRTKGNIPYYTYDELDDTEREQADRGLGIQADKDARARMKDPSLQSRIEMEMRRKGKRAGKKEARTRLTEEAREDLEGKKGERAFMGRGREPGLYGRSAGYDIDTDEGVATYEAGYKGAEKFRGFRPVQLTNFLKGVLREKGKKENIESKFRQAIDDYMRNGGKFERQHITLLNKASLGGSVMMDIVRDNLARR